MNKVHRVLSENITMPCQSGHAFNTSINASQRFSYTLYRCAILCERKRL